MRTFIIILRGIIGLLTGKDILNWHDVFPTDDEIFDIARRICPECGTSSEDEAEELGYHRDSGELALKCQRCGNAFLGDVPGTPIPHSARIDLIQ